MRMPKLVDARIRLFVPEQGGWRSPVDASSGLYAPHLRIGPNGEYLGVRLVQGPAELRPSDSAEVTFELMYDSIEYSTLRVGNHFEILEGLHAVGEG